MNIRLLILLLVACGALVRQETVRAAEIMLHERVRTTGNVLYLGDLADIHAGTPARVNELKTTPLMPTPPRGETLYLRSTQIRDLLASRGISLHGLQLGGAAVVEIGDSIAAEPGATTESEREAVEAAMQQAILAYLSSKTNHSQWELELQPNSRAKEQMALLTGELAVSGGRPAWTGRQQFQLRTVDGKTAVTVHANVVRMETAVIATRPISRGNLVRRSDVKLQPHRGQLPTQAVTSIDDAIGKEARQMLRPGTLLTDGLLVSPRLVERGETVNVYARTGGVVVRTLAVAKQDGAAGELVRVETLDAKQHFVARVSGRGELEVYATGVNATDLALKPRSNTSVR